MGDVVNKDRNTLVIGGAGYIGAHLVPELLATGRRVTVLGRKATPMCELPESVAYVPGDFGQRDLISGLLDCHQEVIHLAYATVPNTSFENPLADLLQTMCYRIQVRIVLQGQLGDAIRRNGLGGMILAYRQFDRFAIYRPAGGHQYQFPASIGHFRK